MSDIDTVAEAIRDAHNEVVFGESNEEAWRRMAQAAIDALQLKEEKRNIRSICDMADTAGIDKRRWVSPWTSVPS